MKPSIAFRAITPADYAEFTAQTSYYPGPQFGGIVAYHDEVDMGAVGLDGWTPTSVVAHWWIKHPRCLLPLWHELQAYLARHGKCKIIGMTPGDNVRALRMIFNRLGWHEIARIRDGWDKGVDIIISEYTIHADQSSSAGLRRSPDSRRTAHGRANGHADAIQPAGATDP